MKIPHVIAAAALAAAIPVHAQQPKPGCDGPESKLLDFPVAQLVVLRHATGFE